MSEVQVACIHSGEASDLHGQDMTAALTEPLGNETLVFVSFAGRDWVSRMLNPRRIAPGETLPMQFDLSQAHLFDAATGASLRS